jgi:hypothetical protein
LAASTIWRAETGERNPTKKTREGQANSRGNAVNIERLKILRGHIASLPSAGCNLGSLTGAIKSDGDALGPITRASIMLELDYDVARSLLSPQRTVDQPAIIRVLDILIDEGAVDWDRAIDETRP